MTDTRMVRLEQIAAGPKPNSHIAALVHSRAETRPPEYFSGLQCRCRQIGDATGGDVYEPINALESAFAEGLRRAKWPHLVQVEVVNG